MKYQVYRWMRVSKDIPSTKELLGEFADFDEAKKCLEESANGLEQQLDKDYKQWHELEHIEQCIDIEDENGLEASFWIEPGKFNNN